MPVNSTPRYQAVTLLIPYRDGIDGEPSEWAFSNMLDTVGAVEVVDWGRPDSDPDVALKELERVL